MVEQLGLARRALWPDGPSPAHASVAPGAGGRCPRPATRFPPAELASFAAIGLLCTFLFALGYQFTRTWFPPMVANTIALTSTAGLNFAANRWLTFRGRTGPLLRQASQYAAVYVVGLAASSLALASFLLLWRQPPHAIELTAALISSGLATAIRYIAMARWVFSPRGH